MLRGVVTVYLLLVLIPIVALQAWAAVRGRKRGTRAQLRFGVTRCTAGRGQAAFAVEELTVTEGGGYDLAVATAPG